MREFQLQVRSLLGLELGFSLVSQARYWVNQWRVAVRVICNLVVLLNMIQIIHCLTSMRDIIIILRRKDTTISYYSSLIKYLKLLLI